MKSIKLKTLLREASFDINDPKSVAELIHTELMKSTGAYNRKQATLVDKILKSNKIPKDVEEEAWNILYDKALQDKERFIEIVLGM